RAAVGVRRGGQEAARLEPGRLGRLAASQKPPFPPHAGEGARRADGGRSDATHPHPGPPPQAGEGAETTTEPTMLKIDNLHAAIGGRDILKGLSLHVKPGEVLAIMGPNGAGKSTLGNILAGREGYGIGAGTVEFDGRPLLELEPEERAAAGVFLAFQYPVEIPGVNNTYFLRSALNAQRRARGDE